MSVHTHGQVAASEGNRYDVWSRTDFGVGQTSHRLPRRAPHLQKVDVMSGQVQIAMGPSGVSRRVRETQVVYRLE